MAFIDQVEWLEQDRKPTANATIQNYEYGTDNSNSIKSFELESNLVSTSNFTLGNVCSSSLKIDLTNVEYARLNTLYREARVDLAIGLKKSGTTDKRYTFFIDEVNTIENRNQTQNITLTCYDGLALLNDEYIPSSNIQQLLDGGVTLKALALDIIAGANTKLRNFRIGNFSESLTVNTIPEGVTRRELLGYLAGFQGGNCITSVQYDNDNNEFYDSIDIVLFADDGNIDTNGIMINRRDQYLDEFTIDGEVITINRIESGTGDEIVVYPSDGTLTNSISYPCPYIKNDIAGQNRLIEILDNIYDFTATYPFMYYKNLSFYPVTVKWRGNPHIPLSCVLRVQPYRTVTMNTTINMIVMTSIINYDGGLSQTFKCYGDAQKKVSFSVNAEMQKINILNRKVSALEQEMADATAALTDLSIIDGHFEFIKNPLSKNNIGWKIISPATGHYIECNANGLGFSSDDGQTFSTAIYIDENGNGHINGAFINAGSITAQMLQFDPITSANVDSYVNTDITNWYNGLTIDGNKISNINAIPGYTTLMNTVNSKATVADATSAGRTAGRSAAREQIQAFTDGHNLTYIGPDGIYTGTINATQLNLGYGGFNYCLLGAHTQGIYADSGIIEHDDGREDSVTYVITTTVNDSPTSTRMLFKPFYCEKGAALTFGGVKLGTSVGTGLFVFQIHKTDSINTVPSMDRNVVYTRSWSVSTTSPVTGYSDAKTVSESGYYWFDIFTRGGSVTRAFQLTDVYIKQSVSGDAIINGKIQNLEGTTVFNVREGKIKTTDSNNSTNYTEISNGGIEISTGNPSNRAFITLETGEVKFSWNKGSEVYGEIGKLSQYKWEYGTENKYGPAFLYNSNNADGLILARYNSGGSDLLVEVTYARGITITRDLTVHGTINNSSSEKYKKDIIKYNNNALNIIDNTVIYSYRYKQDENNEGPLQYGVIIERECPTEIISKDKEAISLYSMTSLAWKAIQELSNKIKKLEEQL